MRKAGVSCLLLTILLASAESSAGVRERRPNFVGGELGGRALIYSINYERFLTPHVGAGLGLTGFGTSDGGVGLLPLYVSFVPLNGTHSPYVSIGATWAVGGGNWSEIDSVWYGTGVVGYLYQATGGFYVRPGVSLYFRDQGFLALPGFGIGGSF